MEVAEIESYGGFDLATLLRGSCRLTASLARPSTFRRGQQVKVMIPLNRIHLFEARIGTALYHAEGPDD
jgi:hypothetical protein